MQLGCFSNDNANKWLLLEYISVLFLDLLMIPERKVEEGAGERFGPMEVNILVPGGTCKEKKEEKN